MPMDCDDNETSRHNLQLAGEGRTRSSSALRPYDFPKFDFDESLQGHLRFDSLVETEVFLGIQSQEDNQWIEDFSRGSNGMEFNPTPADSCSISRRNNVWSEATSSESVEMLLKSVGQEEMMPGTPFIPESEVTNDQGTLSKYVETSNKLKERNDAYIANSETTLPLDEVLKDYSDSRRHIVGRLEDALSHHAKADSACGNSSDFNQNALCGNGGTSINEDIQSCHDECAVENLEEPKASFEKTANIGAGGDSVSFSGTTDNVNSNAGMLSSSKASEQVTSFVSYESCSLDGEEKNVFIKTAPDETAILERKTGVSVPICTGSSSFGSVPESGRDSKEAGLDSVGVSELKSSEGDDKNTSLTTSIQTLRQEEVLATSNEVDEPFDNCKGVSAELGSFDPGHCSSTQQKMDAAVQLPHKLDDTHVEDVSANLLKYKSMSELPLLSMKDNEDLLDRGDCMDNNNIGSSSDMAMLSSSDNHKDSTNVGGSCDDSIVTGEESGAKLLAHDIDVSIQVIQENLVQRQADSKAEGDICKSEEADKKKSNDLKNVDSEHVGTPKDGQRTQSLEVDELVEGNNHRLQPQISGELESGALDDRPEFDQRELAANESIHLDNDCEDAGMKKAHDMNIGTEVESASKGEVNVANDSVRIPLSELSVKSQQPVEKTDGICSSGALSVEAVDSSYVDHPQSYSGCKQSSIKESGDADLVSGDNHEKAMAKEEEKGSLQTPEIDKTSCGSPTIISSSEPLLTEKESQEDGRGCQVAYEFVKDIKPMSEDQTRKDLLGDDNSFTFKVNALPDTAHNEPANNWSPIPDLGKGKVVEETARSPKAKTERTASKKTPRQTARVSDGETGSGTSKGTSERKGRRGPGKGTAKENVKKGNQSKGSIQENATGKVERISNILSSTPISSPHVQYGQMQPHGNIDTSNKKLSAAVAVSASSLPDLNSSALNSSTSQPGPFRQPFSDLQQVQLRAQIFVYGSLIQGTAPDEAYMVSAFGASDGGRSTWEPIWRVAAERVRSQKSSSAAGETPRSQSGARASDAVKQGSHSSKVLATPTPTPTPVSRPSNKDTPAAAINPIIPLSSPLWNISTPSRDSMTSNAMHKGPLDFQPVHPYQTSPIRNFVGHTSWSSPTCFPGSWLASPQTASFSSSVRFRPVTMTETVKPTSIKDTSAVLASGVKHMTSSPAVHTLIPSPALKEVSPLHDSKMVSSAEHHSADTKSRKRKKIPPNCQVSLVSEAQTEPGVVSDVTTLLPSPTGVSSSACRASEVINLSKPIADAERVSSVDHTKKFDSDAEKAVACSEESLSKVAEAKSQAEDAADLATAAVTHCEDLWSQLAKQRESGLTSETEVKLASAAVAIAAAASVAKAAAATAKIACNAALQAKLMADEAFLSSKTSNVQDIENATPASILKSNSATNQPSSILVAAKEAAKRRVEAASAASKQAENLDAIVKAAELAAAAVSQAGKIVAMGEPLPLSELVEAGPEGYWKLPQPSAVLAEKVRAGNIEQSDAVSLGQVADIPASVPAEDSVKNKGSRTASVNDVHLREGPSGSLNVCMNSSDDIMGSQQTDEKGLGTGIDHKASDPSKSGGLASEADVLEKNTNVKNERDEFGTHADDGVKEGSLVEVFKPGNGLKCAWYTASVLNLKNGKAYVCYNDLMSEEGSAHLQEWVPLEGEEGKAPIIRAAHPLSHLQYQQTRKRRRAALGDYAWCVGDKVDVWIDDCWWEGVVTEKNEKDETTLKVHISAQGETSMVRAWNLRRSRSWINGKWVEWSSSSRENASEQSDTPQEKRQKLGTPLLASKAKDKESNNADVALGKPEQSKFLTLSTSDRTFDIGKTTNDDNKRGARRPLRTNQQKEGSRVVFGVPKPTGKKRKFMEVSKHFPANKSDKGSEVNDPVKFTKYLIPQGAASRFSKVPSRSDSKEKRPPAESRPRVLSTRKAHRTLSQRGNLMSSSAQDSEKPMNHGTEDSVGHDENTSEKSKDLGFNVNEEATEAPLSSLLSHSLGTTSKKTSSSHIRSDRLNRGKLVPSGGKLSKIEEDKAYSMSNSKSALDTSEPRRSNRRIQPTHRLLEGLQSSMVIPKMPSVPHDKGRRNLPARGK